MPHTNGSGAKSRLPYRRTKLAVPVKNTRREATLFVDSIFRLIRSGLVWYRQFALVSLVPFPHHNH